MTTSEAEHVSTGWVPDANTFGARLALVRQRMSWGNVKEAAVECGLPAESWRTWERDGVAPRRIVETSELISKRTGCDFMWLLTGSTSINRVTERYPIRPPRRQRETPHKRHSTRPEGSGRAKSYPQSARRPSLIGHHTPV